MTEQAVAEQDAEARQFLTFLLADEVYGIDILNIKEIIGYGDLTPVPMMPEFVAGVINLRGAVVPVINLALRFGLAQSPIGKRTSVVIMEVKEGEETADIGVIVDTVNEVLDIQPEDIAPPPAFGAKIRTDFIRGMGKVDGQFLVLLDVRHVLSIEELSLVEQVRAGAAAPALTASDTHSETT